LLNFVAIAGAVAQIWQFLINFSAVFLLPITFEKLKNSNFPSFDWIQGGSRRHSAKFCFENFNVAEKWRFFYFSCKK